MNINDQKTFRESLKRHTRNESVEAASKILEAHAQPFLRELNDEYCEISEVNVSNHTST